jgi:uncharacterized membrane protein
MGNIVVLTRDEKSAKKLAAIIYVLYAASFIVGITAIIAIIVNYVKKDDVVGTFVESHFRWQIRTFWFGLLWVIIGTITSIILIGWLILSVTIVWIIYRIVKGLLYLNENREMYAPQHCA